MKDKNIAALFALCFGAVGAHKFYLGRVWAGLLYFTFSFTMIPAVLALVDFFALVFMDRDEFNRRFNGANVLPPMVVNMLPPAYGAPSYGYGPHAQPPSYPPHPAAAPGRPVAPGAAPSAPGGLSPSDLAQKLEKLNELRISGLLSEEEFEQQKARVLAQF